MATFRGRIAWVYASYFRSEKKKGLPVGANRGRKLSSRRVPASADRTARQWDAVTGNPIGAPLVGHEDRVHSATFSPDGTHIVAAASDRTARLWDATTGQNISVLTGPERQVYSAAFSSDGKRIVTAADEKTARLWEIFLNTQDFVARAMG
jgi:WD40 repeat protein